MFDLVDKLRDAVPPVLTAPDQVRLRSGLERLAVPIRLEAIGDLAYFV